MSEPYTIKEKLDAILAASAMLKQYQNPEVDITTSAMQRVYDPLFKINRGDRNLPKDDIPNLTHENAKETLSLAIQGAKSILYNNYKQSFKELMQEDKTAAIVNIAKNLQENPKDPSQVLNDMLRRKAFLDALTESCYGGKMTLADNHGTKTNEVTALIKLTAELKAGSSIQDIIQAVKAEQQIQKIIAGAKFLVTDPTNKTAQNKLLENVQNASPEIRRTAFERLGDNSGAHTPAQIQLSNATQLATKLRTAEQSDDNTAEQQIQKIIAKAEHLAEHPTSSRAHGELVTAVEEASPKILQAAFKRLEGNQDAQTRLASAAETLTLLRQAGQSRA
ncbi:MAG: hypothetical protein ACK48E_07180 [Holosporales bacterium]|jgi:hypothetical protein